MQDVVVRNALGSLDKEDIRKSPRIRRRLAEVMPGLRHTDMWTMIVDNAELSSEIPLLLEAALVSDDADFRTTVANLTLKLRGMEYVREEFDRGDALRKEQIVRLARYMGNGETGEWLKQIRADESQSRSLRNEAVRSLANHWNGMPYLIELMEGGELPPEETEYIARVMSQSWRSDQRSRAIDWLRANRAEEAIDLESVAMATGDRDRGEAIFTEYCAACHMVEDEGVQFGPKLTVIGDKLGKDALLSAIVYPSQGISFGYEGVTLQLSDGKQLTGYIESQTEDELTLRMMGGVAQTIDKASITDRIPLGESLMTEGLHELMKEQELADLLAYLHSLREEQLSR